MITWSGEIEGNKGACLTFNGDALHFFVASS